MKEQIRGTSFIDVRARAALLVTIEGIKLAESAPAVTGDLGQCIRSSLSRVVARLSGFLAKPLPPWRTVRLGEGRAV